MTLVRSFTVGSFRCHTLEGGLQRLDGGAMFGVVPRPLWEKAIAPDERHRIPLAMRCLLVEHPDGLVLIDTALGGKEDAKFKDIYGIENESRRDGVSPRSPLTGVDSATGAQPERTSMLTQLDDALAEAGYTPADIRWVINTHLHFDHAGGNTRRDPAEVGHDEGALRLAFPNATYVVQRGELEFARSTNERTRASYLPPNFEPVAAAGKFKLLNGDAQILPGILARLTPGHVPNHQAILIEDGGETAAFVADLIPTSAHLRLPWIMGYDLEPLRTLESKRAILREAANEGWRIVFEHDAAVAWGTVVRTGTSVGLEGTEAVR
jgi:glyoxylase-like metal-dependent hydrolase (beta-lactamase superfamily II)